MAKEVVTLLPKHATPASKDGRQAAHTRQRLPRPSSSLSSLKPSSSPLPAEPERYTGALDDASFKAALDAVAAPGASSSSSSSSSSSASSASQEALDEEDWTQVPPFRWKLSPEELPKPFDYDVAIVGGGVVGAALACRLCEDEFGASGAVKILVVESRAPPLLAAALAAGRPVDVRTYAMTPESEALLRRIGVGATRRGRTAPYEAMQIWSSEFSSSSFSSSAGAAAPCPAATCTSTRSTTAGRGASAPSWSTRRCSRRSSRGSRRWRPRKIDLEVRSGGVDAFDFERKASHGESMGGPRAELVQHPRRRRITTIKRRRAMGAARGR